MKDRDRYELAMNYLKKFFPGIYAEIYRQSQGRAAEFGKDLYLSDLFYLGQAPDKQAAVRALLLCQSVFLRHNHQGTKNVNFEKTGRLYARRTEDDVREGIRCYMTLPHPCLDNVARAAKIPSTKVEPDWAEITRKTPNFQKVCYSAVIHWLFQAGFVSLPTLAFATSMPSGTTPNDRLGRGTEVQTNVHWDYTFRRGEMFNFHMSNKGGESTNHWGIAVGRGQGIAVNNGKDRNLALRSAGKYLSELSDCPDQTRFWLRELADLVREGYMKSVPKGSDVHMVICRIAPGDARFPAYKMAA